MKEKGRIIVVDPGADRPLDEFATAQCVHCGAHFPIRPGSGKIRGFCFRCNGPVCGPACAACVPAELQLDNLEAGRPVDFRPIRSPGVDV
jgi:hypothetical protein